MWYRLGKFILKYKIILLFILLASTAWMGFKGSHVQIGYDFAKAIPVDNPKYKDFLAFKKKFGDDGNTMVLGIETDKLYTPTVFNALSTLQKDLKTVSGVEDIMGIPEIAALVKEDSTEKLSFKKIFHAPVQIKKLYITKAALIVSIFFLYSNRTS